MTVEARMERPDLEGYSEWSMPVGNLARYALALEAQLAGVRALATKTEELFRETGDAPTLLVSALRAVLDAPEQE